MRTLLTKALVVLVLRLIRGIVILVLRPVVLRDLGVFMLSSVMFVGTFIARVVIIILEFAPQGRSHSGCPSFLESKDCDQLRCNEIFIYTYQRPMVLNGLEFSA